MQNDVFIRTFYTKHLKDQIDYLNFALSAIEIESRELMYRTNTANSPSSDMPVPPEVILNDVDTFVITTSAEKENIITYVSPVNVVDLNTRDGGYF